jgi:hypothetical protein
MDRPPTTIARSETAQWFSRGVLEQAGQRWREDAGARLSVIGGPKRTIARSGSSCVQRLRRSRHEYPDLTAPLEIAGEIGNYVKLDTDFS